MIENNTNHQFHSDLGHAKRACCLDGVTQPTIDDGICAPTHTDCRDDLFGELHEGLAALLILRCLLVLDVRPLTVPSKQGEGDR